MIRASKVRSRVGAALGSYMVEHEITGIYKKVCGNSDRSLCSKT